MRIIDRRRLSSVFALAAILAASTAASAQQPSDSQQKSQQTTPAQPGAGMGHEMMRDGMQHGKMGQQPGQKGMEHGRMGSGMKQDGPAPSSDSGATTGTGSATPPSSGSK